MSKSLMFKQQFKIFVLMFCLQLQLVCTSPARQQWTSNDCYVYLLPFRPCKKKDEKFFYFILFSHVCLMLLESPQKINMKNFFFIKIIMIIDNFLKQHSIFLNEMKTINLRENFIISSCFCCFKYRTSIRI
jgi:hypothetical protein